jgi:hypothetical protein
MGQQDILSLAGIHIQFRNLTFYSRSVEQLQERRRIMKFVTSHLAAIGALSSSLGPYSESDLPTYLYSVSTPIAIMYESDCRISIYLLTKFMILLSATVGASDSPFEPCPERDLVIDLHSASTPINIKDESNSRIRFRRL